MQYTKGQREEFERLWESYKLPPDTSAYWTLFDMWLGYRGGQYKTLKTILADSSAYDCARALLQLESYQGGLLHLDCGGQEVDYCSPDLVEAMKVGLQAQLSSRVVKTALPEGVGFIIFKGCGGGDTGRGLKVLCADCNLSERGFSVPELEAIVKSEEKTLKEVRRLSGRKIRDEKKGRRVIKRNEGASEYALLGLTATEILNTIEDVDFQSKELRYSFVFDTILGVGLLEKRPDIESLKQKVNFEKERMVKNWLVSYRESGMKLTL